MAVFGIVDSVALRYRRFVFVNVREKAVPLPFKGLTLALESRVQKVDAGLGGMVPLCF
jgi:hypothetical protein